MVEMIHDHVGRFPWCTARRIPIWVNKHLIPRLCLPFARVWYAHVVLEQLRPIISIFNPGGSAISPRREVVLRLRVAGAFEDPRGLDAAQAPNGLLESKPPCVLMLRPAH